MKQYKLNAYHSAGFSLIELMLAMLIGLIIMAGVMTLYLTTRDTQRSSEDQLALLGDARFAIETIGFDLRHAGIWGELNEWKMVACHKDSELPCADVMPVATADCLTSEYINFKAPLSGSDGVNPFASTCATKSYKAGTDVLGIRYADSNRILTASLAANVAYVRSNIANGQVFFGSTLPAADLYKWNDDTASSNHLLVSRAYYVSSYTSAPGDNLPSLHRVSLEAGPLMKDEILLPGVEDFQLEFGIDSDSDMQVNAYVNASNVPDWSDGSIQAVKVWVLVRSRRVDRDNISAAQTFDIAGATVVTPNDGYRRMLVSSVIKLRNMARVDLKKAGGV